MRTPARRWRSGDPVLTPAAACQRLGISRLELHNLAAEGLLEPVVLGDGYYVSAASVKTHARHRRHPTSATRMTTP